MPRAAYAVVVIVLLLIGVTVIVMRRHRPHRDALPPLTQEERALAAQLERDVRALCAKGTRNVWAADAMQMAQQYIARSLTASGYQVELQLYADGINMIAEVRGGARANEIVVIGAHYDSVDGSPGADDNASGVAALLALAQRFAHAKPARTLRFVFFANEEPPHFQTEAMGSWQYAKQCRERGEKIVGMLAFDAVGYYNDAHASQHYPPPLAPLYPDSGDFIGFASNPSSRALVKRCVSAFRKRSRFPVESAIVPEVIPQIGWSDHWSFWKFGYPAAIVTDTAPFRNPHYHMPTDTPETLDYARSARVVEGIASVIEELAAIR